MMWPWRKGTLHNQQISNNLQSCSVDGRVFVSRVADLELKNFETAPWFGPINRHWDIFASVCILIHSAYWNVSYIFQLGGMSIIHIVYLIHTMQFLVSLCGVHYFKLMLAPELWCTFHQYNFESRFGPTLLEGSISWVRDDANQLR